MTKTVAALDLPRRIGGGRGPVVADARAGIHLVLVLCPFGEDVTQPPDIVDCQTD